MTQPIIEVKNISKEYIIYHDRQSYYTLRDTFTNMLTWPWRLLRGGKVKTGAKKENFKALSQIDFSVYPGETIGVIGKNGAGKSTLLKILSQITPPTTGSIELRGRVASLLEVGTGFHPELTGRENIFLNGAVLGMKQKEIRKKFNEIVAFAEVEKFIDTPVKRYSSGMYVRLAFAVAAHLEPEILIVDEVLAVGDVDFQKKSLGKMGEVTRQEGRTIIFVSHNMEAIRKICNKCILLKDGQIAMFDETQKVIKKYLQREEPTAIVSLRDRKDREGNGLVKFTDIHVTNQRNDKIIKSGDHLKITLAYKSQLQEPINDVRVVVVIANDDLRPVLWFDSDVSIDSLHTPLQPNGTVVCEAKNVDLIHGRYFVTINFHIKGISQDLVLMASDFEVETDITKYHYQKKADNTVSDYLVEYGFTQN